MSPFQKHTRTGLNPGPMPKGNAISAANNGPANKSIMAETKIRPVNACSAPASSGGGVDKAFWRKADDHPTANATPAAKSGSGK